MGRDGQGGAGSRWDWDIEQEGWPTCFACGRDIDPDDASAIVDGTRLIVECGNCRENTISLSSGPKPAIPAAARSSREDSGRTRSAVIKAGSGNDALLVCQMCGREIADEDDAATVDDDFGVYVCGRCVASIPEM